MLLYSGCARGATRAEEIRDAIKDAQPGVIVVLGDSNVQGAPLPDRICGTPVVNAGIGGVTVDWLAQNVGALFGSSKPSLIVVAAGVNDGKAKAPLATTFRTSYAHLIDALRRIAPVIVATIPTIKPGGLSAEYDADLIGTFNAAIRSRPDVTVVDVAEQLSSPATTLDGVHISSAGFTIWMKSVFDAVKQIEPPCRGQ